MEGLGSRSQGFYIVVVCSRVAYFSPFYGGHTGIFILGIPDL